MKRILLSALAGFLTTFAFAQGNYRILDQANNNITNTDVYTWGDENTTLEYDVLVINMAATAKNVKAKRMDAGAQASTTNYFCWQSCYSPNTNVSPMPINMAAGDTSNAFHGYYSPAGVGGESVIMYVFFDQNVPNDSSWVRIHYYGSPTGINEVTGENKLSAAYPNPANASANLSYSLKSNVTEGKIVIYNMLGENVRTVSLDDHQGTVKMHTSEMSNGVYFYSLIADDKVISTRKIVVSH
jgi:hypothetical protein